MELSSEDELRLHVLLANAEAIRIDEQRCIVYGLTGSGELQAALNPAAQSDRYLDAVRQYLSTVVLGSPRHFPSHLRRWAGLGQIQNAPLEKLLLLGDPEAAYAVACSHSLTPDLARKVWWVAPHVETARVLLRNPSVVSSAQGSVLAAWLVDYLPFETNPADILESTRLLLQTNLVNEETRRRLWDRGKRDKAFRVGFLLQVPDDLPPIAPPLVDAAEISARCNALALAGNRVAQYLIKNTSARAQSYLAGVSDVLANAKHQDEISMTLRSIGAYYGGLNDGNAVWEPPEQLQAWLESGRGDARLFAETCELSDHAAVLKPQALALTALAHVDERVVVSMFARSGATGSLMRRQLEPVISQIFNAITTLKAQLQR